jgi:hypothetical protein
MDGLRAIAAAVGRQIDPAPVEPRVSRG